MASPVIGICGAGIGGLAAAIGLRRAGHTVRVFEQARRFTRVGADINLTPNAVRALDGLGLGALLRSSAARPRARISRVWDTGEVTSYLPMADEAERRYGAPQLTMHRGDLMTALEQAVPEGCIRFGKRLQTVKREGEGFRLAFADGTFDDVEVVVGADGIHSAVRAALAGPDQPRFTGMVAYRAVVPIDRVKAPNLDAFTKWWGPDPQTQLITFPLNRGKDLFVFATTAADDWRHESWTLPGNVEEFHAVYAGFHAEARAAIDACSEVMKSALCERDPLPAWSQGSATLLGDACNPMLPFMAQGAGMAIEDAVVLARCLDNVSGSGVTDALARYEQARLERTARIQFGSRGNEWLKDGGNGDWVYGYDAWGVELPPTRAPENAAANSAAH